MYRLNADQTALVEKVRQIADEKIAPQAAEVDAKSQFPRKSIQALAECGFPGFDCAN